MLIPRVDGTRPRFTVASRNASLMKLRDRNRENLRYFPVFTRIICKIKVQDVMILAGGRLGRLPDAFNLRLAAGPSSPVV